MTTTWTKQTKGIIGNDVLSDDTVALADDTTVFAGGLGTNTGWTKQTKS